MAMDYLMDIVIPKSFFETCWKWVTENVDHCIKVCTSAIINGWKYCKNKTKEAFTCCSISASDEADRCVYFSFFSNSKSFMIFLCKCCKCMYLVSSQSIPFWDKFVFVGRTTWRLMAHVFDMARDIILIVFLKFAKRGAHYIFHWVSNQ